MIMKVSSWLVKKPSAFFQGYHTNETHAHRCTHANTCESVQKGTANMHVISDVCVCVCVCRRVYEAVVLSTLLYGAETWTTKACHLRKLNTFHHHCVRSIVGISRRQQWVSRITSDKLASTLGVEAD